MNFLWDLVPIIIPVFLAVVLVVGTVTAATCEPAPDPCPACGTEDWDTEDHFDKDVFHRRCRGCQRRQKFEIEWRDPVDGHPAGHWESI